MDCQCTDIVFTVTVGTSAFVLSRRRCANMADALSSGTVVMGQCRIRFFGIMVGFSIQFRIWHRFSKCQNIRQFRYFSICVISTNFCVAVGVEFPNLYNNPVAEQKFIPIKI